MEYRLSTPIYVMLCEAREAPLKIRYDYLLTSYICKNLAKEIFPASLSLRTLERLSRSRQKRIIALKNSRLLKHYVIYNYLESVTYKFEQLPTFEWDYETFIYRMTYDKSILDIDTDLAEHVRVRFLELSADFRKDALTLYTDGSKAQEYDPVGVGIYSPELQASFRHKLPADTSVFSAEA